MRPVVLGNEFDDRKASGLHVSQQGHSLPREQESWPGESSRAYWGYYQEEEERESQTEIRYSQRKIRQTGEATIREWHI